MWVRIVLDIVEGHIGRNILETVEGHMRISKEKMKKHYPQVKESVLADTNL